jgi:hypothetical protein
MFEKGAWQEVDRDHHENDDVTPKVTPSQAKLSSFRTNWPNGLKGQPHAGWPQATQSPGLRKGKGEESSQNQDAILINSRSPLRRIHCSIIFGMLVYE